MHVLPCSHTARMPESHLVGGIMILPQLTRVLYNHTRHYQIYNYNSVEPEYFVRQLLLQFACDQRKIREYYGALHTVYVTSYFRPTASCPVGFLRSSARQIADVGDPSAKSQPVSLGIVTEYHGAFVRYLYT